MPRLIDPRAYAELPLARYTAPHCGIRGGCHWGVIPRTLRCTCRTLGKNRAQDESVRLVLRRKRKVG